MTDKKDKWVEVTVDTDSIVWDRKKAIEGVYTSVKEKVGPNESMLYTLKTKDGDVSVWGSTVLDTKFAQIKIGSKVMIEPLGITKSEKTGRNYQDFRVFFIPPTYQEIDDEPINIDDVPF